MIDPEDSTPRCPHLVALTVPCEECQLPVEAECPCGDTKCKAQQT